MSNLRIAILGMTNLGDRGIKSPLPIWEHVVDPSIIQNARIVSPLVDGICTVPNACYSSYDCVKVDVYRMCRLLYVFPHPAVTNHKLVKKDYIRNELLRRLQRWEKYKDFRRQGSVDVFAPAMGYQLVKGFFNILLCVWLTTVNILLDRTRA